MRDDRAAALILQDCTLFDGVSDQLRSCHLLIEQGRIKEISDTKLHAQTARVIALGGRFVMPGLIDAHFHAYGHSLNIAEMDRSYPSLRALHARQLLEQTLQRGFTTVRDAGGADLGLVLATERGLIKGPRIFYSGLALSQTGGHGDARPPDHFDLCLCGYCGSMSLVADGPDEVRKAAREQLRHGATQIKLFVSGGVLSPTGPIWMNQFTDEEIRAAVYEAGTRRTYVMAHAHTAEAAKRCVRNGVRSVEHATILDQEGAAMIASHGAFAVPTLAVGDAICELGSSLGLPPFMIDKAREVSAHSLNSLDLLRAAGASIGFGTDLLGVTTPRQSREFRLRREVMGALDILRSATSINAALLNRTGELGVLTPGARADLLVLGSSALDDITVLERHDQILLILKDGAICKHTLQA
jgi:imidazolonepropionase-like amidohydrolase